MESVMEISIPNIRELLSQTIGKDIAEELVKAAEVAADDYGKLLRTELEKRCSTRADLVNDSLLEARYNQHRKMAVWVLARFMQRRIVCELLELTCKICVEAGEGGADFIAHAARHYEMAAGKFIENLAKEEKPEGIGIDANLREMFTMKHGGGNN
jgi:hypothetical protein